MRVQRSVVEGAKLRQPTASCDIPRLKCVMAARTLPSDPEYLLSLMSQIGGDSESNDDFDGSLDDDHRERDDETGSTPLCRRSMSLESLDAAHECSSLTHSPMQLSTLSPTASPTRATLLRSPTHTTLLESPTHPTGNDTTKQFISGPPVFTTEAGVIPNTEGMVPVE